MIEIYHVDEKSSFELDRLVQSQGQFVPLVTNTRTVNKPIKCFSRFFF
jgi:hypothetical protein